MPRLDKNAKIVIDLAHTTSQGGYKYEQKTAVSGRHGQSTHYQRPSTAPYARSGLGNNRTHLTRGCRGKNPDWRTIRCGGQRLPDAHHVRR